MTIHLKNVVSIADLLAARLWRDLDHLRGDDPLRAAVADHAAVVERLCRRAGGGPSDLPPRTRNAYSWLRFLATPDRWLAHLDALRRIRRALAAQPQPVGAAEVHLVAMDGLWRIRDRSRQGRPLLLRLHQSFMAAESGFLEAFAAAWAIRDMATLHRLSRDFSLSGGFAEVSVQLRVLAPEPDTSGQGKVHDLGASFLRVCADRFQGGIERPSLRWGSISARRTFGSYRFSEDRLTISPRLDAPDVPAWVLDFVVFHELLHKEHGLTARGTRRYAHTAAFRRAERAHPQYSEVEAFLRKLSRQRRQG
ncbi:MAG: hypothetical protein ABIK09_00770 [Pseudomonadota bacterium]